MRPKANLAPLMKDLIFRRAEASDLPAIIAMLADDILGRQREDPSTPPNAKYLEALPVYPGRSQPISGGGDPERRSDREPANHFHSRHRTSGRLAWQIEAVRVAAKHRGSGFGQRMFAWAIGQCRARGCTIVQLTIDKTHVDAHRFYVRLGFVASHVGYKLTL